MQVDGTIPEIGRRNKTKLEKAIRATHPNAELIGFSLVFTGVSTKKRWGQYIYTIDGLKGAASIDQTTGRVNFSGTSILTDWILKCFDSASDITTKREGDVEVADFVVLHGTFKGYRSARSQPKGIDWA